MYYCLFNGVSICIEGVIKYKPDLSKGISMQDSFLGLISTLQLYTAPPATTSGCEVVVFGPPTNNLDTY